MKNAMRDAFLDHYRDILETEPGIKNPVREAVKRAGYSQPDTQWPRVAKNYREQLIELTKDILSDAGPEAAMTMVKVMRGEHGAEGAARDKIAAASQVLDRGVGVTKVEKMEIEVAPGLVALPAKAPAQEIPDDEGDAA